MENLLILIPSLAIMLWLCCWLIKKIPEHLLAEYLADQAEIATYQLPPVEKYHLYTALITCSTLFILIISYVQPSSNIKLALLLIFSWSTVLMATIDWRARLLTDNTVYPLLWLGLIANTMNIFCSPTQAIYGAIFCYLILWLLNKLLFLINKKENIGNGDIKMAAALGAWFGLHQITNLLFINIPLYNEDII